MKRAAFVMASSQAAIAQHAAPENSYQPMVHIVSLGIGLSVIGVDALTALRQAIDYAIDGPHPGQAPE